uniref:Uncharacterized protein n=1 Tax=Rhizophora mucronata TaxID=61149 RepID=A0A2P2QNJ7_RHIMU
MPTFNDSYNVNFKILAPNWGNKSNHN